MESSAVHRAEARSAALAERLRARIAGAVRFDDGSRALYATDASNYRQTPIGVVWPQSVDDVVAAVAVAHEHGTPITARGCGTSLAGQCCNATLILDMSKHVNRVLDVDPAKRLARVQPGAILDDLRHAAQPHGLTFGPDPATHDHCTLGGMLGNNSCGVHSVMAVLAGTGARTSDNVHRLDVLTYDGERFSVGPTSEAELESIIAQGGRRGAIYAGLRGLRDRCAGLIRARYPDIPRRVAGYNLDELLPENGFNVARALVGSEGTCVVITEATLQLIANPSARSLLVLGYPDLGSAGDHVPQLMEHKPVGLEAFDHTMIDSMRRKKMLTQQLKLLPQGNAFVLMEFGADSQGAATDMARAAMAALGKGSNPPAVKLCESAAEQSKLWQLREAALAATVFVPGKRDTWAGWEDSAVPPQHVGPYLRELRRLFDAYDYDASIYGHIGQGCIHCRIPFDLTTANGIATYRAFVGKAADLVLRFGGSVSGEHGDGQARGELLPMMFGSELMQAFREFKALWDPHGRMNPGKLIDAYPITANLRLGLDYRPREPQTYFGFPDDEGSFARAALRCVGFGKCRRTGSDAGGSMCPSFMATREEKFSTRGRARLLFEMLRGETIGRRGWNDESVKEALELCLACKGCKSDCPASVDMASYKAEFLAHYYRGRLRPRTAYSMGLIHSWARIASRIPNIANFVMRTAPFNTAVKALGGIAPRRRLPTFATQTFKDWFFARPVRDADAPKVMLWADTFSNYFLPAAARDACEVLEQAGFRVIVPRQALCCGRPLYDFGFLARARAQLRQILDTLRDEIRAGTPLVGLEPSCVAVFRDELRNLFPHDADAQRLAQQSFMLGEFLQTHVPGYAPPQLRRKALLHGHCHHKSVLKLSAEHELLDRLGLDIDAPATGCCGMAGSFGFDTDKVDVSVACAEQALLPAVRAAGDDTLIVADGFSCREQIEQLSDRRALHTAQVLRLAQQSGPTGPLGDRPEAFCREQPAHGLKALEIALLVGGALAAGMAIRAGAARLVPRHPPRAR